MRIYIKHNENSFYNRHSQSISIECHMTFIRNLILFRLQANFQAVLTTSVLLAIKLLIEQANKRTEQK